MIKQYLNRFFALGAIALLLSSNAHALLILDVNIGGGASEYTNVVNDGIDYYIDMSGTGGWTLTIAVATAEPDFSSGIPAIHLSLIASCALDMGCDSLAVTAASDYPVGAEKIALDLGLVVPRNGNATASAYLFTGSYSGSTTSPTVNQSSTLGPWSSSFASTADMIGSNSDSLWGLVAQLSARGPSSSSLDFAVTVPEPGTVGLLGIGLLTLGLMRKRRIGG